MANAARTEAIYRRHFETVWNICYPYFMNKSDTEDAVQETFLRLLRSDKPFRDEQQEKAWLIVTARNICRDELRRARRKDVGLEAVQTAAARETPEDGTLQALASLPDRYRTAIYLYYYEGCSVRDIAKMLHRPDATVRSWLHRGRKLLREQLGGI